MNLVLLGPPGAGKGSLAGLLKEALGISHISTGDILRDEMAKNSLLGQEAKNYMERGELVPDELVTKIVRQKLVVNGAGEKGFMLDGFPRTKVQAEELDKILIEAKKPIDYILYMESTLPVILNRLTGRRVCRKCGALFHLKNKPPKQQGICNECGGELQQRKDDQEDTIRHRIDVYKENIRPIVDYYKRQGKLEIVNGDKETKDVQQALLKKINADGKCN